ncbi:MAG: DNA alkylation repair protein [Planctomycetaceae bacterium]|jgi:3-methyladenine DNA glycosylase AlkD|nr:DNA alkylation repair protein [Planctomycetaceae bacterium]
MTDILKAVRKQLKATADPNTKESGQRFFKEPVKMYGVKAAAVDRIAKDALKSFKNIPKTTIFDLCEQLWHSGIMEESIVACHWAYSLHKQFQPEDFAIFEHWVDEYITNWATCDTLCNHTIGTFVEKYPKFLRDLQRWATSENHWKRRAAAVSLIIPAKKGLFHKDAFAVAKTLLHDTEDLVQKGYGWLLKVASQSDQQKVFEFVMLHKATMPRTALRYAIEKMPQELKTKLMKK